MADPETVWLQATSGRGPEECCVALAGLLPIVTREAEQAGLSCAVLEKEVSPHGLSSALLCVEGAGAGVFGESWAGTVEWLCRSSLRPTHGRKRWYVGVAVIRPDPATDAAIAAADLLWEAMKASGPGGQHVNKTESAVRLTHWPSGVVVTAQEERSQHRNRALALAKLRAKLAEARRSQAAGSARDRWDEHNALERGRAIRTYVGTEFKRKIDPSGGST